MAIVVLLHVHLQHQHLKLPMCYLQVQTSLLSYDIETAQARKMQLIAEEASLLPFKPKDSTTSVRTYFWVDNFDVTVEIATGGGSVNTTHLVAFQEIDEIVSTNTSVTVDRIKSRRLLFDDNLSSLNLLIDKKKDPELLQDISFTSELSQDISFTSELLQDISFTSELLQDISFTSELLQDISFTSEFLQDISFTSELLQDISFTSELLQDISFTSELLQERNMNCFCLTFFFFSLYH